MYRSPTAYEEELLKMVEPYMVYEDGGYVREDAPEAVKRAKAELEEIGRKQMEDFARECAETVVILKDPE